MAIIIVNEVNTLIQVKTTWNFEKDIERRRRKGKQKLKQKWEYYYFSLQMEIAHKQGHWGYRMKETEAKQRSGEGKEGRSG